MEWIIFYESTVLLPGDVGHCMNIEMYEFCLGSPQRSLIQHRLLSLFLITQHKYMVRCHCWRYHTLLAVGNKEVHLILARKLPPCCLVFYNAKWCYSSCCEAVDNKGKCCGRFFCVDTPRLPMDLGLEGEVHTKLAGVDHSVFWGTKRKLERHIEGIIRSDLRRCMAFSIWEGGEESRWSFLHCSVVYSLIFNS